MLIMNIISEDTRSLVNDSTDETIATVTLSAETTEEEWIYALSAYGVTDENGNLVTLTSQTAN